MGTRSVWKLRYWARIYIEKLFCIFRIEFLQEKIKTLIGRHSTINDEFISRRIDRKMQCLLPIVRNLDINTVHEQGTGWHGIDLIVFYLLGLRTYTCDVRPLLKLDLILKAVEYVVNNKEKYSEHSKRIRPLEIFLDRREKALGNLLSLLEVTYYVDEKFEFRECDAIDFLYSDSVLQRLKIVDLGRYLKNSKLVASPSAIHFHTIDCKDFFSIGREETVPPLYYLKTSSWYWEAITCKFLNYQNRLRMPEFGELFREAGYRVDYERVVRNTSDENYVKLNLRGYKGFSDDDISVTSFDLVGR